MQMRAYVLGTAVAVGALIAVAAGDVSVVGSQGPSTTSTPYIVPVAAGVRTVSIFTAGESVNKKLDGAADYRMVGIPDGLGVIPAGDGTMIVTMNHEINANSATARAHGSNGAFVSAWKIDPVTLQVKSGDDLIRTVMLWNATTQTYAPGTTSFDRFCSADVPAQSAFWNAATGLGSTERFHMNGEETGGGRAVAHQITGVDAGVSWELPRLGKQAWENVVACPYAQDKTVVVGTDDTTPGQVYVYVGTKAASGNEVQKAGLTNGTLYGVRANNVGAEIRASGVGLAKSTPASPVSGSFLLLALPDQSVAGANTETAASSAGVTTFLRPEDGAWDPVNPSNFYFVTTDSALPTGRARLWRLHFADITSPTAGGTVEMLLDGTEGGDMYDNVCVDRTGHVYLEEDLGGNAKSGKIWRYDVATGALTQIAKHDVARFGDAGGPGPTAPFNNDEEGSGIVDASDLLGPGWFLTVSQSHYAISGELFQGGQLMALYDPASVAPPAISAAATASPASPWAGQSVAFDVSAATGGAGALTYSWNFGDGTSASGKSVSHTYSASGTFTATVTVTHAASGLSAQSSVQVNVGRTANIIDSTISLVFSTSGKDRVTLTGEVPIPAGYSPSGSQITLDVGGVVRTFTMDANGNASPNASESFRLVLRRNADTSVPAQRGWFEMILSNEDLRPSFVNEGFTSRTTTNEQGTVAVVVTFGGSTQSFMRDVSYTASANNKGLAR